MTLDDLAKRFLPPPRIYLFPHLPGLMFAQHFVDCPGGSRGWYYAMSGEMYWRLTNHIYRKHQSKGPFGEICPTIIEPGLTSVVFVIQKPPQSWFALEGAEPSHHDPFWKIELKPEPFKGT